MNLDKFKADAYQAECERFDPEIEKRTATYPPAATNCYRVARTPGMRALVDKLIEAEEAAAEVRKRGFFVAGVVAGIRIGLKTAATPWEGPSALETILASPSCLSR
ncbi:MAG: hypothetical protein K6U03_00560 [Firmicutes bacterium]|nr:hypothetical protein [Bacillota bacterium]